MEQRQGLGDMVREQLAQQYSLQKKELGADARLSKSGMVFETEVYEIAELGHFCILRMNAFLGLMKMETAVLAVSGKDVPLINLDWVRVMGRETQIVELYDTQLAPWPDAARSEFDALRRRDGDLPDTVTSAHWYDAILYPCSYHKVGRKISDRLRAAARDYTALYLRQLADAPVCDSAAKQEKTRAFAARLFAEGGPAVDQVTKLFGAEIAKRLILRHMYGAAD